MPAAPPDDQVVKLAHTVSHLLGWSYFLCWSVSFYPQLFANYSRKSVTGLALDYFVVNIFGFGCYTVSSLLFLVSPVVREQYARRHPVSPEPTVRWNDSAFAAHATLISFLAWSQFFFWGYKRDPSQRMSRSMLAVIYACFLYLLISIFLVLSNTSDFGLLDFAYSLQFVKLCISVVKYVPQAWLNYKRKATTGWSIHNVLLDFSGGLLSLAQLVLDSSLQHDWSGLIGNPLKFFLSQIAIIFDIIFILQHYVFYPDPTDPTPRRRSLGGSESSYGTFRGVPKSPRAVDDKRMSPKSPRRPFDEEGRDTDNARSRV